MSLHVLTMRSLCNCILTLCVIGTLHSVIVTAAHPQVTSIKERGNSVLSSSRALGIHQGRIPLARRVGRPIFYLGPSSSVSFPRGRWRRRHGIWADRARLQENVAKRIRLEQLKHERRQNRLNTYAARIPVTGRPNEPIVLGPADKQPVLKVKPVVDTQATNQQKQNQVSRVAVDNTAAGIPIHIQDRTLSESGHGSQHGRVETIRKNMDVIPRVIKDKGKPHIQNEQLDPLQNSSLMQLLNEREVVFDNKEDEAELRLHVSGLKDIQMNEGLDATNEVLIRKQLQYIDSINNSVIKREVLKLFVKDIVEKSGFLTKSQHTSSDITEMASLLELIKSITSERTSSSKSVTMVNQKSGDLRNRISTGLEIDNYRLSNKTVEQQTGVNLDHLVGLSVYGGRLRKNETISGIVDVVMPKTTAAPDTTTKFDPRFEPLGGNDAYWTHLTAGFQDMLCALCQKQNNESCIVRYCQDDV